jgi:hypothetical protein
LSFRQLQNRYLIISPVYLTGAVQKLSIFYYP